MKKDIIEFYTLPMCSACEQVEDILVASDINYLTYDLSVDDKARKDFIKMGFNSVPILMKGGKSGIVIDGFKPKDIQLLIEGIDKEE